VTWGQKIRLLAIQKLNRFTSGACKCTVLLEGVKVKLYLHKCVKEIVLGIFCGYNGKTSTVCHQWTR